MNPRAANRLLDALDSARAVQHFIEGYTLGTFVESRLVRSAVERELATIGEAINAALRVEPSLIEGIPSLREWISLRNILIHAYNDILPEVIWETVVSELPALIGAFESLLAVPDEGEDR